MKKHAWKSKIHFRCFGVFYHARVIEIGWIGIVVAVVCLLLLALARPVLADPPATPPDRDVIFQASTIGALLDGVYDGDMPLSELRRHGDFGIGTINALDGELIYLNGAFFTVRADGSVSLLTGDTQTPFAAVTHFEADHTHEVSNVVSYDRLKALVDGMLPTTNICHAIRITGVFSRVKTRSVPRQSRPYPKLAEVVKSQPVFEFEQVSGTLVGFRLPGFVAGVNVPGYHLHFLADDLSGGGHLLDCAIAEATVEIDHSRGFFVALPATEDFSACDASQERKEELERVEQDDH